MKNVITISREYGSGGYEIGQKIADVLGYEFYDKELISRIAEKTLISESYTKSTEDKMIRRNIFRETFPFLSNGECRCRLCFRAAGKIYRGTGRKRKLRDRRAQGGLLSPGQPQRFPHFLLCRHRF